MMNTIIHELNAAIEVPQVCNPETLAADLQAQKLARARLGFDCDVREYLVLCQQIKQEILAKTKREHESEMEQARRLR